MQVCPIPEVMLDQVVASLVQQLRLFDAQDVGKSNLRDVVDPFSLTSRNIRGE